MWRLPGQARAGIDTIGIVKSLRDSPYEEGQLRRWLYDHDLYMWGAKYMSRMIRGPSRGSESLDENVEEFVRVYKTLLRAVAGESVPRPSRVSFSCDTVVPPIILSYLHFARVLLLGCYR
jgi:hypothetical protein